MTEGDTRAEAMGREAGCCGNEQWRGRLCQYHMGWADGFDAAHEPEALPPVPKLDSPLAPEAPPPGPSFTCPRCGRTSHNPSDVRAGYCGACNDWTGPGLDLAR